MIVLQILSMFILSEPTNISALLAQESTEIAFYHKSTINILLIQS